MPKFLDVTDKAAARTALGVLGDLEQATATVVSYGAKGDGRSGTGSINSGSASLNVSGAGFTSADLGKVAVVYGAGTGGAPLDTTIIAVVSGTQVTLADNAATTASSKEVVWGTDDTVAIQDAFDSGRDIQFPAGIFMVSSGAVPENDPYVLITSQGQNVSGAGVTKTTMYYRPSSDQFAQLWIRGGTLTGMKIDGGHVPVSSVVLNDLVTCGLVISNNGVARDVHVTRTRSSSVLLLPGSVVNCLLEKFGDHAVYAGKNAVAAEDPHSGVFVTGCRIVQDTSYYNNGDYGTVRGVVKVRENVENVVISDNHMIGDQCVFLSGKNGFTEEVPKAITITGNVFDTTYSAVQVQTHASDTPGSLQISDVTISGNIMRKYGGGSGNGVTFIKSTANVVGNTLIGLGVGVYWGEQDGSNPWKVVGNDFRDCAYGVYGAPTDSLVSSNVFNGCPVGVLVNRHHTVNGNVFNDSTTTAVWIATASSSTATAVIDANVFAHNTLALTISSSALSYSITNNTFIDNTTLATVGHGSSFNALTIENNRIMSGAGWPTTSTDSVTLTRPALITGIAPTVTASTGKTTPADADELPLVDSAASNVLKKLTWSNLKGTIASYYNDVTATMTGKSISLGSNTVTGTTAQFNTALSDGNFATLDGTETLTAKTLTSPKIGTGLQDSNGVQMLQFVATSSAANHLAIRNATNAFPSIEAAGSASDVNIMLVPKGAGNLTMYVNTGQTPTIAANGADAAHNLNLTSKGTGVVQANGNPVGVKVAVPASASATGVVGQWAADSSWIYVCTAANTWVRGALATW